jgi:4-hydroxymandelate oxidase
VSQRPTPIEELVNAFEFEEAARRALAPAVFSTIAGSERAALDRVTFRPRMNVPTLDLDMSIELFGQPHFAPIVVGPISEQRRFHAEGELATARGAAAANAAMVIASHSSAPIADIAAAHKGPLWYAVYADDLAASERSIAEAAKVGCKALCLAIEKAADAGRPPTPTRINWAAIDRARKAASVPIVIKGVADDAVALAALDHGAQGLVVSSRGTSVPSWIETLPSIADRVRGKAALLMDGNFRRGSDILKALILGAQAVLVSRPVMWGLASYGADGVRAIVETLQSDLARQFCAIGAPNASKLTRDMVRVHRR